MLHRDWYTWAVTQVCVRVKGRTCSQDGHQAHAAGTRSGWEAVRSEDSVQVGNAGRGAARWQCHALAAAQGREGMRDGN